MLVKHLLGIKNYFVMQELSSHHYQEKVNLLGRGFFRQNLPSRKMPFITTSKK
jgi:hypothetical protein